MSDGADQAPTFPVDDSKLRVECPDCPMVRDEETRALRRQQWTFEVEDLPGAKAFAARHRSLQSHEVTITQLATVIVRQDQMPTEFWDQLTGLGDVGDTQGIRR